MTPELEIRNLKKEIKDIKLVIKYIMSQLKIGVSTKDFKQFYDQKNDKSQ